MGEILPSHGCCALWVRSLPPSLGSFPLRLAYAGQVGWADAMLGMTMFVSSFRAPPRGEESHPWHTPCML